jgi:RNA polymerase sigma-70 factor (ECF subfamily)
MREPSGDTGVYRCETDRRVEDERDLLRAIRAGDADAFEQVAREHSPRMFRLALHLTGRREDAEDLVQETMVRALPALHRFEGRSSLSTYLIRALTNLWKNRLRSRSRSRIVDWVRGRGRDEDDRGDPLLEHADPRPGADDHLEAADRAVAVREAVARLEPSRRLTLLLREVEEMSYEEIATMTGVPVGTVRSRLARARDDLRGLLGGRL